MEEFQLSLEGDYVRFQFSDASVQDCLRIMPKRSFCKSKLLSKLLVAMDEKTTLVSHAPAGVLSAWIDVHGMNGLKSIAEHPSVAVKSLKVRYQAIVLVAGSLGGPFPHTSLFRRLPVY